MTEENWRFISKQPVHEGFVRLSEHQVELPQGERIVYEVDESVPFAVAVLGITGAGDLRLSRQFRYPLGRWIIDLPGGAGNLGEDRITAARREHEEETGLRPIDLVPLHSFAHDPGRANYFVHVFFCREVVPGNPVIDDPQEVVHTIKMPVAEFDNKVRSGEIIDPTLLIARLIAGLKGYLPPAL